jgi:DNA polymerase elongation subunit (family B)
MGVEVTRVNPAKVKKAFRLRAQGKDEDEEEVKEEAELDEATMSSSQIARLKKSYEPMRDKKISVSNANKLSAMMDKVGKDKEALIQLFKADIPFVSQSAVTKLITKHNMKGAEINKLREEVGESYEIGTDEYRDHTLEVTPGQSLTWGSANAYKQASMKEALAKVWGLDEKALDKSSKEKYDEEDEELKPVKGSKTMTGGKVAKVEIQPKIDG